MHARHPATTSSTISLAPRAQPPHRHHGFGHWCNYKCLRRAHVRAALLPSIPMTAAPAAPALTMTVRIIAYIPQAFQLRRPDRLHGHHGQPAGQPASQTASQPAGRCVGRERHRSYSFSFFPAEPQKMRRVLLWRVFARPLARANVSMNRTRECFRTRTRQKLAKKEES